MTNTRPSLPQLQAVGGRVRKSNVLLVVIATLHAATRKKNLSVTKMFSASRRNRGEETTQTHHTIHQVMVQLSSSGPERSGPLKIDLSSAVRYHYAMCSTAVQSRQPDVVPDHVPNLNH